MHSGGLELALVLLLAAVIAVMAGERAGIWKIAEPTLMRSVWAASQASTVATSDP